MNTQPISDMLARRTPGYALEQAFYTSAAVFQADMETIFYRDWRFAAVASEMPKAGSFVTHQGQCAKTGLPLSSLDLRVGWAPAMGA